VNANLPVNGGEMIADRALAQEQGMGDGGNPFTGDQPPENLGLSFAQPPQNRIGPPRLCAGREVTDTGRLNLRRYPPEVIF
jgi:hypothetical protein